jgi:hypothetical protein
MSSVCPPLFLTLRACVIKTPIFPALTDFNLIGRCKDLVGTKSADVYILLGDATMCIARRRRRRQHTCGDVDGLILSDIFDDQLISAGVFLHHAELNCPIDEERDLGSPGVGL